MRFILAVIVALGCGPNGASSNVAPKSSCFRTCNSNIECTSLVNTCRFCNFGTCSDTLPRTPIENAAAADAGVDAP